MEIVVFLIVVLCLFASRLASGTYTRNMNINGVQGSENLAISGESSVFANADVLAAQPGSLTTRTNNTSGTITMTNAGHGIITGQRVDLYWTLLGVDYKAYNAVVGTVSGLSVPIASVGGGDVLPAALTVINVGIPNQVVFNVVGDNVQGIILATTVATGYIIVASNSTDLWVKYVTPTTPAMYKNTDPGTNPLVGVTATKVWFSQKDTANTVADMKAAVIVA